MDLVLLTMIAEHEKAGTKDIYSGGLKWRMSKDILDLFSQGDKLIGEYPILYSIPIEIVEEIGTLQLK